ncbi:MAG: protoheme IX farnesyltransferase [Candidatus Dadabacteria bacterium]|nr:protoheme IX farnesyltransferase [Candidatus Dadabacteria bacterium]NIS10235.1 protoheme IX farnesyltransferase [Candidatus Dadabacteria bacterium]NIV42680.1 protoheme IX farnesyltransferase [Candidatus Dadabacteria bacterium]NIX16604.1 protoheme IX farnesyltransferase [Candidatus Dadabacteria bacterium]NIY23151.1 protoheme IX farnesyltransferase [Candidatus Dadabacteria bacterium]
MGEDTKISTENVSAGKFVTSTIVLLKPRIIMSVVFTGFAGMVLAQRAIPGGDLIFYTLISLFLSAGGSAVLNNVLDKDLDTLMDRLGKRVEAMKTVGNRQALIISVALMVSALFISVYFINLVNAFLIILAILSYTVLYTLYLKRSSPYGTILGGLPGALPVLIGYSAVDPSLGIGAWILFIFMILWQPPHFWALAQKYKDDYAKAKIPVMPVVFGSSYTNIFILLYSISLIPLSLSLWFFGICSEYYAILVLIIGIYFEYVMLSSVLSKSNYGKAFGVSILYMLSFMLILILDIYLNTDNNQQLFHAYY